jgi:hypothetical protein
MAAPYPLCRVKKNMCLSETNPAILDESGRALKLSNEWLEANLEPESYQGVVAISQVKNSCNAFSPGDLSLSSLREQWVAKAKLEVKCFNATKVMLDSKFEAELPEASVTFADMAEALSEYSAEQLTSAVKELVLQHKPFEFFMGVAENKGEIEVITKRGSERAANERTGRALFARLLRANPAIDQGDYYNNDAGAEAWDLSGMRSDMDIDGSAGEGGREGGDGTEPVD